MTFKYWLGSVVMVAAVIGSSAAEAAPIASVPPQSFGSVRVDTALVTTNERTFNITNTGDAPFTIMDVSVGGTDAGDFTITDEPAADTVLDMGQTASVTVVFDPSATGARSATLTVTSTAANSPTDAALTGTGTSAVIAVTDYAFGTVAPGGNGAGMITISNTVMTDQGPLRVTAATIAETGSGTPWFSFGANGAGCNNSTTCMLNLAVTADQTINVRCRPPMGATGARTATVTFVSDTDPTGADFVSQLTCDTGPPDINVVTAMVAFGDVPINPSPAPSMPVTIQNTGNDTLTFTASESSPLYTLGGCSTNCDVAPGTSEQFTVTFNPTAPTIPNANITITVTSNDPDAGEATVTIPVTGRGVAGVLAVSVPPGGGTSYDFGSVAVGAAAIKTFTLSNTGNLAVGNIAAAVSPMNAGYSIDPAGNSVPTSLAAGDSVTLTARFAPLSGSAGGPATITFTGNSGATPPQTTAVLSLDGDALSADYTLSETELDFGDLRYDGSRDLRFCITSTGEAQVQIQSPISIAPGTGTTTGEFSVVSIRRPTTCGGTSTMDVTLPQTLDMGQLLEVTVRADPADRTGPMLATLTVNSNLGTNPTRMLTLRGNSTSAMFTVSPSSTIAFGAVDVQGMEQSRTVTITNNGDAALELRNVLRMTNSAFTVLVNGNAVPATMPGLSVTVAPAGGTATVTVRYKPTTVSTGESITLRHDIVGALAGPSSQTYMISGRGIDRNIEIVATPLFPDTFRNPGDMAPVRAARIRNTGEAPLKIASAMLEDDGGGVWQLIDGSGITIPMGASQEFLVRFSPTAEGRTSTGLLITNDDDTQPLIRIEVVGVGVNRDVRFSPATIQFGYTAVGVPVTLEGALSIASVDALHTYQIASIELDEGSPFTIEGFEPNAELPALAERKFAVTFTPTTQGPFTATARLFLDQNPVAEHQITIEGTAVFVDAHGGGGCAVGGDGRAGGATLALALAALLAGRRRRRRAVSTAAADTAALFALAALALAPRAASADDLVLSVFDPVPATTSNGFQLQSPDVGKSGDWVASAVVSHATDPLILDGIANGVLVSDHAVISRSTAVNLGGAVALFGRLEIGARLPIYVQDGQPLGDPTQGYTAPPAEGNARGDLALHAKLRLAKLRLEGDGAFIIGLGGQVSLPTATEGQFAGGGGPAGRALLLGSLMPGAFDRRITLTMNVGAVLRGSSSYMNLEQKSGVAWGLGAQVRAHDAVWLATEVYGDTVPGGRTDEMTRSRVLSPIEWLAGLRLSPDPRFTFGLAAGRGLTNAVGTPAFRGVFSLTITPGAKPEPRPAPPPPPPDGDADRDGVRDSVDRCPNEGEDKDLYDDTDGCPDLDNDGDQIADADDKCPIEAEDKDGVDDADGCVDKDNDGDQIADTNDKCPMEPEDKDGFMDTDGCPDEDNDRDGIADGSDRCPTSAETINGNQDDDGCPDKGDSLVVLSPDRIEMLDAVQFTPSQKIAKASHNLLGQVGAMMRARTEIARLRVTVHVQPTGDEERDQELSDKRSAAVRDWLVAWGLPAARLEVRGFGGSKPLMPPERKGSAALNERVELIILERK